MCDGWPIAAEQAIFYCRFHRPHWRSFILRSCLLCLRAPQEAGWPCDWWPRASQEEHICLPRKTRWHRMREEEKCKEGEREGVRESRRMRRRMRRRRGHASGTHQCSPHTGQFIRIIKPCLTLKVKLTINLTWIQKKRDKGIVTPATKTSVSSLLS